MDELIKNEMGKFSDREKEIAICAIAFALMNAPKEVPPIPPIIAMLSEVMAKDFFEDYASFRALHSDEAVEATPDINVEGE